MELEVLSNLHVKPSSYFKLFTALFLLISSFQALSQQKEIELDKLYRRTVPTGKVWYISNRSLHKIIFTDGVFESGTACNAALHSNPSYILGIVCYDTLTQLTHLPQIYGFTIKQSPNLLYNDVYAVKPHFLIKDEINAVMLKNSLAWIDVPDEIDFYPGAILQTTGCVNSIILYERDFSKIDKKNLLSLIKKKTADLNTIQKERVEHEQIKERLKLIKYNYDKSTYKLSELQNTKDLFGNGGFDTACKKIGLSIKAIVAGDLNKYQHDIFPSQSTLEIMVHVKWDSLGHVVNYQVNCKHPFDKIKMDSILTLSTPPRVSFQNRSRGCFVEDDVKFLISFDVTEEIGYIIKKTKKGDKFISDKNPQNNPYIENFLSTKQLFVGKYYYVSFGNCRLNIKFIPTSDSNDYTNNALVNERCVSIYNESY